MIMGIVFSIEEFSVFDGPGIRTSVFLKGCPMRCRWCHNPEGQEFKVQAVKNINSCVECGLCSDAIMLKNIPLCPANALRLCGTEYTSEMLVEKLLKNKNILNKNGGGITFSGGEPIAQPEFLKECLSRLKGHTHRAIQTSGYGDDFGNILKETDYVLFDIKIIDELKHIEYTGMSNEKILHNFSILTESGVPFCVRIPLIPDVTDTVKNISEICRFLKGKGVNYVELMPYQKMAGSKYKMTGREYSPQFDEGKDVNFRENIFQEYGIKIKKL